MDIELAWDIIDSIDSILSDPSYFGQIKEFHRKKTSRSLNKTVITLNFLSDERDEELAS
mgnify:CR=1 FL=1